VAKHTQHVAPNNVAIVWPGLKINHSTTHALIDLCNNISSALDPKEHAVGIVLDLSNAHNTVNHENNTL